MATPVKAVLEGCEARLVEVKILDIINKNLLLVADGSCACLLTVSASDFKKDATLKIMKPRRISDQQISPNPKFPPMVSSKAVKTIALSQADQEELKTKAAGLSPSGTADLGPTFQDLEAYAPKTSVKLFAWCVRSYISRRCQNFMYLWRVVLG